jgi:hypothetical protein
VKEQFRVLLVELIDVQNDEREAEILEVLDEISPDPEYLDYVFQSTEFYQGDDLDIDGIIKKVFSYRPISL